MGLVDSEAKGLFNTSCYQTLCFLSLESRFKKQHKTN